ncbi:MAG: hypothetical protein K6B46_03830 [Opitutales bacterium]|nr:hypothetical protein [Opitutales bacterium]
MSKNQLSKLGFILAAGAFSAVNAAAGVFVITDDACPAAKGDLEAHLNWEAAIATNHGKAVEYAPAIEFAYGATDTLEIGASLDFGGVYNSGHFARVTDGERINRFNFTGISLGLKNQILDPEAENSPFGLAFVGGFSWAFADAAQNSARDITFELGLNFQKNLLDGDLILAFTPAVAFTSVKGDKAATGSSDTTFDSTEYSLAGGVSYSVGAGCRLGVEAVYTIAYNSEGFDTDQFYAGPNFCYEADAWWLTLTVAPRLFTSADDVIVAGQFGYVF